MLLFCPKGGGVVADNNSVGKISLDMELTSDLSKQIEQAAAKIGDQIKAALGNIGNIDIGKQLTSSIEKSMDAMQKIIEQKLTSALEKSMANMKAIKIPVEFDIPKNFSMPKQNFNASTAQPRAPPMPKMNTGINMEALKSQIDSWTSQLDIFSNKADEAREKVTKLQAQIEQLSKPTGNEISDYINTHEIKDLQTQLDKAQAELNKFASQSDKAGFKIADLDRQFEILSSAAKNASSGIGAADNKLKNIASSASKANTGMKNMSSSTDRMSNSMNHSYGGIGMFIKSMFTWGMIFPMVIGGITTLGTFLGSTLMVNAQFANSLNQIKSNLYTAFMPIYEAILPALNYI
ncbi:MAG: hypothetical protein K0S61_4854 [Anaerocolumna sp.]|nr:hypothetical protein [Anaerocolumna sp.]